MNANVSSRKMPAQKPGKSFQSYATPREFLDAVERRFGPIAFDLAASKTNAVVSGYFNEKQDSLKQNWVHVSGNLWLNPPYSNIAPWAEKCAGQRNAARWTLLLVPAATGAAWFQESLVRHGYVLDFAPRLSFDGLAPYPKDCVLACFGFGVIGRGFWRWDE